MAILAMLFSIMTPTLNLTFMKMKIARSKNNLKIIGPFIIGYHLSNDGYGAHRTNGGCWYRPASGDNYHRYWGLMYDMDKTWFHSPLTWTTIQKNSDGRREDGHKYVDYGFNGVAAWWHDEVACFDHTRFRRARDVDTYVYPAQTIWAQDHSEPMIDGNGDVPCYAFANDRNAFNRAHPDFNPGAPHIANSEVALQEIFRNRGMCHVLWADGHVSSLSIDHQWKPSWYTGGHQGAEQAWKKANSGKYTQPPPYNYSAAHLGRL